MFTVYDLYKISEGFVKILNQTEISSVEAKTANSIELENMVACSTVAVSHFLCSSNRFSQGSLTLTGPLC